MYICYNCGKTFEEPKLIIEKHGCESPPYESVTSCPYCGGSFTKTYQCDICHEYATDCYIKLTDGSIICDNCYTQYSIGEE